MGVIQYVRKLWWLLWLYSCRRTVWGCLFRGLQWNMEYSAYHRQGIRANVAGAACAYQGIPRSPGVTVKQNWAIFGKQFSPTFLL